MAIGEILMNPIFKIKESFFHFLFCAIIGIILTFGIGFLYFKEFVFVVCFFYLASILLICKAGNIFNKTSSQMKPLAIVAIILVLIFQIAVAGGIEFTYDETKNDLQLKYTDYLSDNPSDTVGALWFLVNHYYDHQFNGSYGTQQQIPIRSFYNSYNPYFTPLFNVYFNHLNGSQKLGVIGKSGNCGEFARSVSLLLNQTTGFETRVVEIQGVDHAFPEVRIDNEWWVFDKLYLTSAYPVKASDFAYINSPQFNEKIGDLRSPGLSYSLLDEHGYNEVNLTITAIADPAGGEVDNVNLKEAEIEIFGLVNQRDPLITKGRTDSEGNLFVTVKGDKEYSIVAKSKKPTRLVNVSTFRITEKQNQNLSLYLYKYE